MLLIFFTIINYTRKKMLNKNVTDFMNEHYRKKQAAKLIMNKILVLA